MLPSVALFLSSIQTMKFNQNRCWSKYFLHLPTSTWCLYWDVLKVLTAHNFSSFKLVKFIHLLIEFMQLLTFWNHTTLSRFTLVSRFTDLCRLHSSTLLNHTIDIVIETLDNNPPLSMQHVLNVFFIIWYGTLSPALMWNNSFTDWKQCTRTSGCHTGEQAAIPPCSWTQEEHHPYIPHCSRQVRHPMHVSKCSWRLWWTVQDSFCVRYVLQQSTSQYVHLYPNNNLRNRRRPGKGNT